MVRNSTHDVESGTSSNRKKGKTSLGLIIALAVALVAAIVFMSVFIVYQQKYAAAQNELALQNKTLEEEKEKVKAQKLKLKSLTELSGEMLDTATSKRPNAEAVLMKREIKYGPILEADGSIPADTKFYAHDDNDFNIMQFNMLADGLCGLYDDPEDPETYGTFGYAMSKQNQHTLYWRYRLPLIIAEIIENKADIVTIQENDHPDAIENALNVRAKKDSKSKEDIWKCEYVARTESPIENVAYLPVGKHKKDGSTICWDVTKFTQDKEFEQKESAYSDYEPTVDGLSEQTISNGNIYVAVKLNHTATKKNIVVVTTQLESEKTLGGEIMRMQQMKELMKKMNEWKKNGLNIIFTSDLNAIPEQNTRDISREAENIVLEEFNLEGKWYCQKIDQDQMGGGDDKTYKAEFKDMSFIKADGSSIPITSKPYKFTMSIDKTDYELQKFSMKNKWRSTDRKKTINCQEVTAPNAEIVPDTVTAGIFNIRLQNFCGKTFYDSFSQKYVIDQYDSATPKKTNMTINGADQWTIEKDEDKKGYMAKSTNADTKVLCFLPEQHHIYEWNCVEDDTGKNPFKMIWSHKLNTYKLNYPDGVYNYITNDVTTETKVDVDAKVKLVKQGITDFATTNGSVIEGAKDKYKKLVEKTVDDIVTVAEEDKKKQHRNGLKKLSKSASIGPKRTSDRYEWKSSTY